VRYRVQLFARYAELLGADEIALLLAPGATGTDLLHSLRTLPGGEALPGSPFLAVNRAHSPLSTVLHPADEIALLPPMAGG
jgi:molybdopterin converting factor small subunit